MNARAASLPHSRLRSSGGTPIVGTVTRGTTNPNRLRRMDRWIAVTHGAALRRDTTDHTALATLLDTIPTQHPL
ncbi:hypothetical protein AB0D38_07170, partial [Streptomyces sp. NPDC048279]